jgi:NTE family protein
LKRIEEVPMALPGQPPDQAGGVASVFQGGGSLAAPHVGMLCALSEAGLLPDLVVGSSAGALNAVAFASDPSPVGLGRLEAMWLSLRRQRVAPFSARALLAAVTGRGGGLVSGSGLRGLLEGAAIARALEGMPIPAHVVATDLASGATVVLSAGDIVPALLALIVPISRFVPASGGGGRLLVDGCVSAVPVLQAETLGAWVSYVLPAAATDVVRAVPGRPLPLALHALGQLLGTVARHELAAARGTVHVLPAPSTPVISPVDFRGTARLIDEGYRAAATGQRTDSQPSPGRPARQSVGVI